MRQPFFEPSVEALRAVTGLYDFVWPTAAALWNLRWQVSGYCSARPAASVEELRARFVEGSGLTGANLRRACIEFSWEQQTEVLAGVLLTNLFAAYEGWSKRIVALLGLPPTLSAKLQLPGIVAALAGLPTRSELMEATVYSVLRTNARYDLGLVENWALCYRYFKSVRNKQIHDHGIADKVSEDSYTRFLPVANPAALGLNQVPRHYPVIAGSPVALDLRGVVGFSDVLLRLIITIDAELSCQQNAEKFLKLRWLAVRPATRAFKSGVHERRNQLERVFSRLGYRGVIVTPEIEAALKAKGIATWR